MKVVWLYKTRLPWSRLFSHLSWAGKLVLKHWICGLERGNLVNLGENGDELSYNPIKFSAV
jgi:hypothetical protein